MKPRSFGAMREDRVRAMAQARFGRAFGSKADAVDALSRLPVAEQHALKKPRDGSVKAAAPKAKRPASAWARNFDAIRGGANAPNARTLAWTALNKPEVLRRYARAAVSIDAKSPLQALVVLSKHGASKRLKRAAGEAFGMFKNGHLAGRIGEVSSGAQAMAKQATRTSAKMARAVPKNAAGLAIAGVIAAGALIASSRASQASQSKPASADVRDGGDVAAALSLTAAGVGIGVAGIRNTSIADKARALRDSLTTRAADRTAAAASATEKAGRTAGLLDKLFRPGKVSGINARAALAASRAETHTAVAGRLAAIAGKPGGIEGHLRAAHNARIASATGLSRTGAAIAGALLRNPGRVGTAMIVGGIAALYAAQRAHTKPGGAYLSSGAAAKAATPAASSPVTTGGRAPAAASKPDGETAGYSRQRRTASGLVINEQVSSYRTPTR